MHELYKGTNKQKRFNELKNKLQDVTPKTLSTRLKELEKHGLVEKKVDDSVFPVKSEYTLTESGEEFLYILQNIKQWGLKWHFDNPECGGTNCKTCEL